MADGIYEIHLNSRDGTSLSPSSELSSILFKLKRPIDVPYGRAQLALVGGKIPRTFYIIDELNCKFNIKIDAVEYNNIELAHGNPTAYQVASEMQSALASATGKTWVVSYSPRTNKYALAMAQIAEALVELSFNNDSKLFRVLGFTNAVHSFALSAGTFRLYSDITGTLSSIPSCSIHLEGFAFEDGLTVNGASSIIHRQYFRSAPNGYEIVDSTGHLDWKTCTIPAGNIGYFIISMKDSDAREIDFNGVDWEITLYVKTSMWR